MKTYKDWKIGDEVRHRFNTDSGGKIIKIGYDCDGTIIRICYESKGIFRKKWEVWERIENLFLVIE